MTRRSDLFARLSLDYADHPKIAGLSDTAFRAHIEMILYSRRYMTDGAIAKQIAKRWPEQALSELLANDSCTPSLTLNDDGSYQLHGFEEMQETRAEIEQKRRIRAEAGRKGGLAKAKQSAKQPGSKLPSKNVAETETETETYTSAADAATEESFEAWWKHYPRKIGKGQARKAFKAALKKTELDTLTTAVEVYAESVTGKDQQYIAHPATWLNGERWDDEAPPEATSEAKPDIQAGITKDIDGYTSQEYRFYEDIEEVARAKHYGHQPPPLSEFIVFPGDPATDAHITGPSRRPVRYRPNAGG